jgi:hypothetical protein
MKHQSPIRSSYAAEYAAAYDRAANLGLKVPPRVLISRDCVDPDKTMEALLDYYGRHDPCDLVGQTVAINLALPPILYEATGVPFQLTIRWIEQGGEPRFQHGAELVTRFLAQKDEAWRREGLPFHLWLTSPALEILDVTFAMNLGWTETREECARLIIYKKGQAQGDPIYHPTLVGDDFLIRTGIIS